MSRLFTCLACDIISMTQLGQSDSLARERMEYQESFMRIAMELVAVLCAYFGRMEIKLNKVVTHEHAKLD